MTDGVSEDKEESVEEANIEIAQLQGLVAELREGFHAALTELCELRQRDHGLEEKLQAHQTDVDDKIMGLKNSLNTFKEELNMALFHIKDVSNRQREVQKTIEMLQSENTQDILSASHSRKGSKADLLSGDEHICVPSQSDLSVIQQFFSSLPHSSSTHRSSTSTHTSASEQEAQQQRGCPSKSPAWGERKNSREEPERPNIQTENTFWETLTLMQAVRIKDQYYMRAIQANISFNGSEAPTSKDKRPFPSTLRFLIQQHLELLHTLQERVLKCQWQGIMGDVFMRLTSKESDFLDFYVSYLKELPDCVTVVNMLASSSIKTSAFLESEIMGDESRPSLHTLLLQPVQRIPEYLLLLQTTAEHPDYYLLLVCIQQFRSFTTQYHHLLQHNQELLLLHNRKEVKSAMLEHANQVKRSKQRLLDQIQSHRFQEWEPDRESHCYDTEWPSQLTYFNPELDSQNHKPTGLDSIPESEGGSCQHRLPSRPAERAVPGSALADALGEFLLPPDPRGWRDSTRRTDFTMSPCSTAAPPALRIPPSTSPS
ncbi:hypothetical protein KUCAC02_024242 [Chaenocephalus aceratus]|uniref:Uncharacterized protein n=1 Tax=Chaenocephalus aceratus TaxID=36190 RepID=A0ACB9WIR1_CHAAC|nr:hypothetical protein KUCAC02_024242 [Chaenocephalus aceratus]